MKKCSRCQLAQDNDRFHKDSQSKSGFKSQCKTCCLSAAKNYRTLNKDKVREAKQKCYLSKKEKYRLMHSSYFFNNKAKLLKINKDWQLSNKEKMRAYRAKWKINNPEEVRADNNYRKSLKRRATPPWITEEHLKEIKAWYRAAAECKWLSDEKLHVDHIIPLRGKDVCGLHVPWNLQVLPASTNFRKSNKVR